MNANDRQVGGGHYAGEIQHWDVVYERGWCYLVGCATKYLWRLGRKGDASKKIEDIEKAIHFLQKKVEQLQAENVARSSTLEEAYELCAPTRDYVDQD